MIYYLTNKEKRRIKFLFWSSILFCVIGLPLVFNYFAPFIPISIEVESGRYGFCGIGLICLVYATCAFTTAMDSFSKNSWMEIHTPTKYDKVSISNLQYYEYKDLEVKCPIENNHVKKVWNKIKKDYDISNIFCWIFVSIIICSGLCLFVCLFTHLFTSYRLPNNIVNILLGCWIVGFMVGIIGFANVNNNRELCRVKNVFVYPLVKYKVEDKCIHGKYSYLTYYGKLKKESFSDSNIENIIYDLEENETPFMIDFWFRGALAGGYLQISTINEHFKMYHLHKSDDNRIMVIEDKPHKKIKLAKRTKTIKIVPIDNVIENEIIFLEEPKNKTT